MKKVYRVQARVATNNPGRFFRRNRNDVDIDENIFARGQRSETLAVY